MPIQNLTHTVGLTSLFDQQAEAQVESGLISSAGHHASNVLLLDPLKKVNKKSITLTKSHYIARFRITELNPVPATLSI